MAQTPEKATLLEALAEFLLTEVRPTVRDTDASFRVLVAANLASILANDTREKDARARAQLSRLRRLLPDVPVVVDETRGASGRLDALRTLNAALADRMRTGGFVDDHQRAAAWTHVTRGLRETLGAPASFPN